MSGNYPDRIRRLPVYEGRFDAFRLAARGADVLFASYPPGTEIPPHTHETDNIGVITRGALILTVGETETTYGPGDWYQVPAGVEHAARFEQGTDEIEFWFTPDPAVPEPEK